MSSRVLMMSVVIVKLGWLEFSSIIAFKSGLNSVTLFIINSAAELENKSLGLGITGIIARSAISKAESENELSIPIIDSCCSGFDCGFYSTFWLSPALSSLERAYQQYSSKSLRTCWGLINLSL